MLYLDINDATKLRRLIIQVLTKRHFQLNNSCESCLNALAHEMYTAGLINKEIHRSPKFDDIIGEFKAGIDLITTHSELKDHCAKFLKACIEQGGAIAIAARTLQNDWREVGMEVCLD